MTVCRLSTDAHGVLDTVVHEVSEKSGECGVLLERTHGQIFSNLRIGADIGATVALSANEGITSNGVMLGSRGFLVPGSIELGESSSLVRDAVNGSDILRRTRGIRIFDTHGLTEEALRTEFPVAHNHLLVSVLGAVKGKNLVDRPKQWWTFAKSRPAMRAALAGLQRYLVTPETAKHRIFQFVSIQTLAEHPMSAIGLDDAAWLSVLSSHIHVTWSLAAGGRLGLGNDPRYNKTRCFDPFPFPTPTDEQKHHLRTLGEQLDAHRKARQAEHPDLTLTDMYNVLQKLRDPEQPALTPKERAIHDKGLVSVLRQLHDEIDTAVFAAYGWPADLDDESILERLVALNAERAAEEAAGHVRWLRPEYQDPNYRAATQPDLPLSQTSDTLDADDSADNEPQVAPGKRATPASRIPWPKTMPEQAAVIQRLLAEQPTATAKDLAGHFKGAKLALVEGWVETLRGLGR
jgi:hypothetical protein